MTEHMNTDPLTVLLRDRESQIYQNTAQVIMAIRFFNDLVISYTKETIRFRLYNISFATLYSIFVILHDEILVADPSLALEHVNIDLNSYTRSKVSQMIISFR